MRMLLNNHLNKPCFDFFKRLFTIFTMQIQYKFAILHELLILRPKKA